MYLVIFRLVLRAGCGDLIVSVPDHCLSFYFIMGKTTSSHFSVVFDRIIFILAGNEDMHKSLDEFEFRPDPTTDYGVSCP